MTRRAISSNENIAGRRGSVSEVYSDTVRVLFVMREFLAPLDLQVAGQPFSELFAVHSEYEARLAFFAVAHCGFLTASLGIVDAEV